MKPAEIIENNLRRVQSEIAAACQRSGRDSRDVTLVAVTKTADVPAIRVLFDLGVRDFGESRPQVLWNKQPQLPSDTRWHLIGHLQTNKVRRTLPMIDCLHSLDRIPLAEVVSEEAQRLGRAIPVTLQVNLTQEIAKHGFSASDLLAQYRQIVALPGLKIEGLMTMARVEEDPELCRPTFASLRQLRDQLRAEFTDGPPLPILSMGMSHDFVVAVEEGATHVRVGSALFEGL